MRNVRITDGSHPSRAARHAAVKLMLATEIAISVAPGSPAQTIIPMNEIGGVQLVQVSVNGAGPYAFVLDTGANVTMVKAQLVRTLNILAREPVTIAGSLGESRHQRVEPGSISIGDMRVDNIEIDTLEDGQLGILEGRAQGILGENFLKYFDVLIDNERHALTLDRTDTLAHSLTGERLPLSPAGRFDVELTLDRLVVPLKAPSLLRRSMSFLVDSGSNTAVIYPSKNEVLPFPRGAAHGQIHSLNSDQVCQVGRTPLTIGSQTYPGVVMAVCENRTRANMDTDGLLPTHLFRRLFISHREKYVIADPRAANAVTHPGSEAGRH
jgi:predicted aspartyl protease